MICPIDGNGLIEADVYLNAFGGISFEPIYKNLEIDGCYAAPLEVLVHEFIEFSRNGETGRIENREASAAFMLLDALTRCVAMLEDVIYDD